MIAARHALFAAVLLTILAQPLAAAEPATNPAPTKPKAAAQDEKSKSDWKTLINVETLIGQLDDAKLLLIDARTPAEYAAGHIPGAINLPGVNWRTPPTKNPATEGVGSQIFRTAEGQLDIARYEKFLSDAGIKPDHKIVVYGNYAGKADGSLPAALLLKLGHESVAFLDGVGADEWVKAGKKLSKEPRTLAASTYKATQADPARLWSYRDVLAHLQDDDVVIVDSRTAGEFEGNDLRGNLRGGHIPGAKSLDSELFLDKDSKKTIDLDQAREKIEAVLPKDKTIVIYCQSGTRCSHKELMLKDLGYKNVILYDASFQEWGNRKDTPIEGAEKGKEKAPDKGAEKPADKVKEKTPAKKP